MLIFDFDGVLVDTVDEMAVSTFNTLTDNLATTTDELPGNSGALFRTNRYHIQTAGDGVALMGWCLAQAHLAPDHQMTKKEYETQRDRAPGSRHDRAMKFFEVRKRFLDHDTDRWRALNAPYKPLWDQLLSRGDSVIILTHKNREAVVNLCHHYGLMILSKQVYSGDTGASKIENLLSIQRDFGREQFTFVDDNVENLKELNGHFNSDHPVIRLLLATWGYIGPDDRTEADLNGFSTVSQTEVIEMLAERS